MQPGIAVSEHGIIDMMSLTRSTIQSRPSHLAGSAAAAAAVVGDDCVRSMSHCEEGLASMGHGELALRHKIYCDHGAVC